jgi:hypothetical protein
MPQPHDKFKARRLAVAREILRPTFPEDLVQWDDGSWTCSAVSFDMLARSFRRYGLTLEASWSFDTLFDRFAFILVASGRVPGAGTGAQHDYSPAMHAYLLAVQHRDDELIAQTLGAALAEHDRPEPSASPGTPARGPAPTLQLAH